MAISTQTPDSQTKTNPAKFMTDRLTGSCQCGHIQYSVSERPYGLNVCHCKDCQKQSGSAFGMSLVIKPGALTIEAGTIKEFTLQAESGRLKTCGFCPECGVRIYNKTAAICSVKAGTLDDTNQLSPDAHYWTRSKQPWTEIAVDTPSFDTT